MTARIALLAAVVMSWTASCRSPKEGSTPAATASPPTRDMSDFDYCRSFSNLCWQASYQNRGQGCPEPEAIEIRFPHGSADLSDVEKSVLDEASREPEGWKPTVRLQLAARHDPGEDPALDVLRIESVRRRLVTLAVPPARLVPIESSASTQSGMSSNGGNVVIIAVGCAP